VYPAQRRATRDLLRRRMPFAHTRAALLAHVQHTTSPYTLPALGKKRAYTANRDGVAARFADPAGQKSLAGDLARIPSYDEWLRAVERTLRTTAKPHDAHPLSLRHTGPGIGTILRRVRLYEIPDSTRFPRGQDVVADGRLVQCAQASGGKRLGTAGATSGNAQRKGACAEAAVLFRRDQPAAQTYRARVENKPDQGKALTILAQQLARAVYYRRKRPGAFERETCFQGAGRGADEPAVSLDHEGCPCQRRSRRLHALRL
jgi:hypothetical protein